MMQVQVVDQTTHPPKCHSFVGLDRQIGSSPPALFEKGRRGKKKEGSFTSIQMLHTHTQTDRQTDTHTHTDRHTHTHIHTHTRQSRENPERQEEEKSGHTTGRSAGGGRGTNGPPEPTYTAKRTWPKQRTHLNPTTHYGEARGEN